MVLVGVCKDLEVMSRQIKSWAFPHVFGPGSDGKGRTEGESPRLTY